MSKKILIVNDLHNLNEIKQIMVAFNEQPLSAPGLFSLMACIVPDFLDIHNIFKSTECFSAGFESRGNKFRKKLRGGRERTIYSGNEPRAVFHIGRNEVCPLCSSGKKYKFCCGKNHK